MASLRGGSQASLTWYLGGSLLVCHPSGWTALSLFDGHCHRAGRTARCGTGRSMSASNPTVGSAGASSGSKMFWKFKSRPALCANNGRVPGVMCSPPRPPLSPPTAPPSPPPPPRRPPLPPEVSSLFLSADGHPSVGSSATRLRDSMSDSMVQTKALGQQLGHQDDNGLSTSCAMAIAAGSGAVFLLFVIVVWHCAIKRGLPCGRVPLPSPPPAPHHLCEL